jgi:hypothetical protein
MELDGVMQTRQESWLTKQNEKRLHIPTSRVCIYGAADAYRHCLWSCFMTRAVGAGKAKRIGDNHERHGGGPKSERDMDQWNNREGRRSGLEDSCGFNDDGSCQSKCADKLRRGKLRNLKGKSMSPGEGCWSVGARGCYEL